jgi:glycosyltransferase involved in cell wall biosynthesis
MLGWEFPPFKSGGLGVHCYELTLRLARMGHKIDFFMPVVGQPLTSPHENIRLMEVAETVLKPYLSFSKKGQRATYGSGLPAAVGIYNAQVAKMLLEKHAVEKYDVIHAHDWLTVKGACEASAKSGLAHVHTFHSTEYDRTSYPWDFVLETEKQGARESDLIIAVSKRTREQVMRLGADEGKIRVVYNGVDSGKYRSLPEVHPSSAISRLRKDDKKIVLFLGRLTEQKGPVQFLHAAKQVLSAEPNTLFVIAGKGELLPLLINMSIVLGISSNVKFLGYVPEEEQCKIYKIADVYVMPSTSEPFGITALEAMSSGVPVIVSKTSGVAEVAKSAIKVDFWDIKMMAQKIVAVLRFAPLSRTMVRLSNGEVNEHTWEKAADGTMRVYNEAISEYGKQVPALR